MLSYVDEWLQLTEGLKRAGFPTAPHVRVREYSKSLTLGLAMRVSLKRSSVGNDRPARRYPGVRVHRDSAPRFQCKASKALPHWTHQSGVYERAAVLKAAVLENRALEL